MKTYFKTLFGAVLSMGVTALSAQTPEMLDIKCANGETAGTNNSLYNDYFPKGGTAKPSEAYEPWKALYDAVPNFNSALYINGEKILKSKINDAAKAKDAETAKKFATELCELYDNRAKYEFFSAQVSREVLQLKKIDVQKLYKLVSLDETYKAYTDVLSAFRGGAEPYYIGQWCDLSLNLAKKGSQDKNAYIDDYMHSTEYLDEALDRYVLRYTDDTTKLVAARGAGQDTTKLFKAATTTKSLINISRNMKMGLTQQFAQSGYADVNTLVEIFSPQVEEKKSDLAFLNNVSKLLGRSAEGRETDLYTHVADYSYQIQPSMEAAKGLAKAALKAKDFDRALNYYDEALGHAIQPDDKTEILMYEAAIYQQQGNKAKARDVLRKSLSIDPDQDTPHVMIANMYATSANSSGADKPSLKSLVYVAAYNEMQQAVAHASSDEKKAAYQRTMASYKAAFPEKGALFMEASKSPGQSYTIGGWMGVTVTIQCQ